MRNVSGNGNSRILAVMPFLSPPSSLPALPVPGRGKAVRDS